jgi:hypothetical protein
MHCMVFLSLGTVLMAFMKVDTHYTVGTDSVLVLEWLMHIELYRSCIALLKDKEPTQFTTLFHFHLVSAGVLF